MIEYNLPEGSRWTIIIEFSNDLDQRRRKWAWCKCSCGSLRAMRKCYILNGESKSCGCYNLDKIRERSSTHRCSGKNKTKEYSTYYNLKDRCFNPKNSHYPSYGGRGITVCERWLSSFEKFLEDVGIAPGPQYSLDRKDNNGNYEPNNVRWATIKEQQRNTRRNKVITYNG